MKIVKLLLIVGDNLCALNIIGYVFMLRIHENDCGKCDVWLSCCVPRDFVKMGQKSEIVILS